MPFVIMPGFIFIVFGTPTCTYKTKLLRLFGLFGLLLLELFKVVQGCSGNEIIIININKKKKKIHTHTHTVQKVPSFLRSKRYPFHDAWPKCVVFDCVIV